jgi:simple sugar transport system ATP-binding protein
LLSGGNLQRTILAREISALPNLLVAVHPTRGLDIGATESVHKTLLEHRGKGAALLLISEDLDEILALSDRIAVLYEGEIMGIVPAEKADIEKLGLMMAGSLREPTACDPPAGFALKGSNPKGSEPAGGSREKAA